MSGCQRKSSALMNRRNDCSEGQCGQGTASDLCMLPSAVQLRPTATLHTALSPRQRPSRAQASGQEPDPRLNRTLKPSWQPWLDQSVQREPGRYAVAQLLMASLKCSHTARAHPLLLWQLDCFMHE
ncbi:hypothetical protein L1887_59439 [Cichorium endivia]|nr:hypothetical protein L1887_59439 [Cichorium endivia]